MSTRALFQVLHWQLPPAQKLVAIFAGDQANDDGEAWFSIARACAFTSLSERTVRIALRALEAAGKIRRQSQPGRANRFTIELKSPVDKPVDKSRMGGQILQGGGAITAGEGGRFCPPI